MWDEDVTGWVFIHRGSWKISVCKFSVAIPSRTVLICARKQYTQSEPLLNLFAFGKQQPLLLNEVLLSFYTKLAGKGFRRVTSFFSSFSSFFLRQRTSSQCWAGLCFIRSVWGCEQSQRASQ